MSGMIAKVVVALGKEMVKLAVVKGVEMVVEEVKALEISAEEVQKGK